jgi:hypothetical protein
VTLWAVRYLPLLIFLSCASRHVPQQPVTPTTWVGEHVDRVTAAWGYPDEITTAPNGNTLLIFSKPRQLRQGAPTLDGASMSAATSSTTRRGHCETLVEVNERHVVVRVDFRGKGC